MAEKIYAVEPSELRPIKQKLADKEEVHEEVQRLPEFNLARASKLSQFWIPPNQTLSENIYCLFDNPHSSRLSLGITIIITILIIASCISFILASLPRYKYPKFGDKEGDQPVFFLVFEDFCIICFTLEYALRLICVPGLSWEMLQEKAKATPPKYGEHFWRKIVYFDLSESTWPMTTMLI